MRIGLFGQFGSGNTGNDGSLEAMLQFLKRTCPETQLICICSNPTLITDKFKLEAVPVGQPISQNTALRAINRILLQLPRRIIGFISAISLAHGIDLIIVPGTGILDDFNEDPFGWPFAVLRWSLAAKLGGARFAFVSIGAGPVTNPLSRLFVRGAAALADYRSYRDQISYDFMKSLRLNILQDHVSADLAFSLTPVVDDSRNVTFRCVGLGIMAYSGWKKQEADCTGIYKSYLLKMTETVEGLLQKGFKVRLLTGDQCDFKAIEDLQKMLKENDAAEVIFDPVTSLHELKQQIAKTDIVIASRYHNIVCALSMGRPAISLGYARKNDALLSEAGLTEFSHHIENFDPHIVLSQVDSMYARREKLTKLVKAGVTRYRKRLTLQEDIMIAELLCKQNPDTNN